MSVYDATAVANEFIALASRDNIPVTNMKLQKLVYIANGYCLGKLNKPLIDNDVHAFEFGPVIPTLYNKLKKYGSKQIEELIPTNASSLLRGGQAISLVEEVWEAYKQLSANKLSAITHEPNTPWAETWQNNKYGVILPETIKSHYKELLNERRTIKSPVAF